MIPVINTWVVAASVTLVDLQTHRLLDIKFAATPELTLTQYRDYVVRFVSLFCMSTTIRVYIQHNSQIKLGSVNILKYFVNKNIIRKYVKIFHN